MTTTEEQNRVLGGNLERVRGAIRAAAARSGRDPADVRLVAVTKSVGSCIIGGLVRQGVADLGENRIQIAAPKIERFPDGPDWHLIGHLQSNKARRAVTLFSWIHSVDSVPLFERIDRIAGELRLRPKVLFQVNVAAEKAKSGVPEEALPGLVERAAEATAAEAVGLMTMAPFSDNPEESRPWYRRLRELLEGLRQNGRVSARFRHLSMGMTDDFEVAVEEGATLVRVGRALFQGLEKPEMDG